MRQHPGPTARAAEFALELRWEYLPTDVRAQATRCLLDVCGAAIAGSRTRVARMTAAYVEAAYGVGAATVIGTGVGSTPAGASLANGFAASSLDIDDGYRPVKGHPGAVTFPAVLAAAEEARASGAELLTALVVAYEVAMRAGRILHPLYDFYHGTGSWGPVGAAAGTARLLGCDAGQTWHALGIAEFHAAMTPELRSVDHPSMLKDGIGWGALVGFSAAQLARLDFTGIPSLFDTGGAADALVDSLGREFLIRDVYFKPYACCRWAQPAIAGARAAAAALGVAGLAVARVRVHTFEAALHLRATAPSTSEEAQFSLPWPVAAALLDGDVGPDQVLEDALADPARRALAARVEVLLDPALERAFPEQALAWVEIDTYDGRQSRSEVLAAPGGAETPPTDAALRRKFDRLVGPVLGQDRTDALAATIRTLAAAPDVHDLSRLLRHTAPAALPHGTTRSQGGSA